MKINILLLAALLVVEKLLETVIYAMTHGGLRWPADGTLQLTLIILSGLKLNVLYGRALILALVFTVKRPLGWLKYSGILIMPASNCIMYLIAGWLSGDEAKWVFAGNRIGDTFIMSSIVASLVCAPFYVWLIQRNEPTRQPSSTSEG